MAVVVTALTTLLGCLAALGPALGRVIEAVADVAILLPPVLGIMLLSLAGRGRPAVTVAAITLGTPYAVRFVAGAAAPLAASASGFFEAAAADGERLFHLTLREILPKLRERRAARPPPRCPVGRPAAPGRPRPGARPRARVLLLDEPTAGLDPALRDEIGALLRDLAGNRHLAIVLACHDPALVERYADDVAI
ncbi:AAA family ATPase [Streptomyces noursei]|nr:AAA family ATPase [Streptomyces noursei]